MTGTSPIANARRGSVIEPLEARIAPAAAVFELSSLDGTNGFKVGSVPPFNDSPSHLVSEAGDVNGDGFDDVIVGVSGANPNGRYSGASYVVFGKASGFPVSSNLSTLDGSNGFKLSGVAAYDDSGISVSEAGDVNGDGFDDLIIGASGADPNGNGSGASYVVFGKASGFAASLNLSTLDGSNGFMLSGVAVGDTTGFSVSSAGDVNRDGFDDLIIGALSADANGSDSGASYVVFGKVSGFAANLNLSTLDGSNGFKLSGVTAGDFSGFSVSRAGDVNGDGFGDLIIGAAGASYVVFGKASGFAAILNLSSLDGSNGFKLSGLPAQATSVSEAGDLNGDGFDDLIIGAPYADPNGSDSGASYVVFGRASGFAANLNLSTLDGRNGFKLSGVAADDRSGRSVSGAGDVNGDGFDDLIIGASGAASNGSSSGAGYVLFGKASGFAASLNLSTLDGSNGFKLSGVAVGDGSGRSVSGAGDVNGDGFGDIIIGAFGASFVVFGGALEGHPGLAINDVTVVEPASGTATASFTVTLLSPSAETVTVQYSTANGTATAVDDYMPVSGSTLTFAPGETTKTVLIPINADSAREEPESFVVNLSNAINATLPDPQGVGTILEASPVFYLSSLNGSNGVALTGAGDSVSSAGDVNGDGFDDVIVGKIRGGTFTSGVSYVVFGKATGFAGNLDLLTLDGSNGFSLNGAAGEYAGRVSAAGDVNGDGFDDVIIGAYRASPNGSECGKSYVVFGRAGNFAAALDLSTLDGANGFQLTGVSSNDHAGAAVSGAGDVNGDGFDDVIIGAPGADSNGVNSGASYVVFGKASGFAAILNLAALDGSNGFRLSGVTANDHFGASVSDAGDVNGDGFDDLIVAADHARPSNGASYVIFGKATGFAASVDVSSLDGSNGFKITGYSGVASSVSGAGDINGDGLDDVIVSAYILTQFGTSSSARSYVVFGKADGFAASINLMTLDGTNGFRLTREGYWGGSNQGVSAAGDLNSDGFADLIVGAPGTGPNAASLVGRSYVVFGKASGFAANLDLSMLDGTNGFEIRGITRGDASGYSVSAAGDVDGDGVADLIIGARGGNQASYIVFGNHFEDPPTLSINNVSVAEGNGKVTASFVVALSSPSVQTISVQYATADGTATAPEDYTPLGLTVVTFNPGEISKTIVVTVNGDLAVETDETFFVNLSNPINATITNAQGQGTISNDDLPSLRINDASVTESAGGSVTASFTITLSEPISKAVSVKYATADGTATAPGDYTALGLTLLTFDPGELSKTVSVTVNGDTGSERDESFFVFLSNPTNATIADNEGQGTILNDDGPGPSLSINDASITESAGGPVTASFTVSLSEPSGETVRVQYATANGAATAPADYTALGLTLLTFNPGEMSKTVSVLVNGDTLFESDETFFVNLSNPINAMISDGQGRGTIINDDVPGPSLSINDAVVVETAGGTVAASFNVTLSEPSSKIVRVQYATSNGTAVAPSDYTEIDLTTLTFNPGQVSKTVIVMVNGDIPVEADETFFVNLSNPINAAIADAQGQGKILNDDTAAVFELASLDGTNGFEISGLAAGDSFGNGTSVSDAGDINGDGFDDFMIGTSGADSNGISNSGAAYVVFGKASGFPAHLNLSTLDGSNGFKLSGVQAYDSAGDAVSAAGDINGDGFGDVIIGAFAADSNGVYNSGAAYVIFGKAAGFASNLNLSTLDGSNGFKIDGGATLGYLGLSVTGGGDINRDGFDDVMIAALFAGADRSGASYVIFGKANGFLAHFDLSTLDGSNGFEISGAAMSHSLRRSISAAGDINADGFDDLIIGTSLSLPGLNVPPQYGASYVVFGKPGGFGPNLNLSTLDGSNGFKITSDTLSRFSQETVSGASDFNGDGFDDVMVGEYYTNASYIIFGKANGFTADLNLSTLDGSNGLKLSGAPFDQSGRSLSAAGDFNGDGFGDVIIGARGASPNGSFSGASYLVFGKASGFVANLNLSALDGSDGFKLNGVATNDYAGNSVSTAGDINGDGLDDLIISARGADPNGDSSGASYVVFGNHFGGPTAISINNVGVTEGSSGAVAASFVVTLSSPSTKTVSVRYATADGAATAPGDYTRVGSTVLTFNPGETSKTIAVMVNGDVAFEPDETFFVNLSSPINATLADPQGQGTILNDDATVSINDVSVVEGEAGDVVASFAVTLSAPSTETISVRYTTANGAATAPADYTPVGSALLTFNPGEISKTVNVTVKGDTVVEPDETFFVNLSNPTNATIADAQGQGTILNDDPSGVPSLRVNDVSVVEGGTGAVFASFAVTLSAPSMQTVSVQYATADGTAAAPGDYESIELTTLTFNPGEVSKTIAVAVLGDTSIEANETFSIVLSNATNAVIANASGSATILNDDTAVRVSDSSVLEGHGGEGPTTFTISLVEPSALPVSVSFMNAGGTATAGVDYALSPGTVTFAPGETRKLIPISIIGDTVAESTETLSVLLSNPANAAIEDGEGVITILDDDVTLHGKRKATFTDLDGDLVTIKVSKGTLAVEDFAIVPSGVGAQLALVDFHGETQFTGANLSITAKRALGTNGGNHLVNVGKINIAGIDFGKIMVKGDLGRIDAGDDLDSRPALLSLSAHSLGVQPLDTQLPGGSSQSEIVGTIKTFKLIESMQDAALSVSGDIGKVVIGGSVLGSSIRSDGRIGSIKIGGDLARGGENVATISARGQLAPASNGKAVALASLSIGGSVDHAQILTGYDRNGVAVNADASIGPVQVGRDWKASSLVAGVAAGTDGLFGTDDDTLIARDTPLIARIASILIKGTVSGTESDSDHFGVVAEAIGAFVTGAGRIALTRGPGNDLSGINVASTGDLRVREVADR